MKILYSNDYAALKNFLLEEDNEILIKILTNLWNLLDFQFSQSKLI